MKRIVLTKMLLAGLFLAVFNTSCTDLEEELFSEVTPENFFRTEEEFISSLGAAYTSLYNYGSNGSIFSLQEVTTDEMVVPTRGQDWNDGGHWRRLHTHQYNSEDPIINGGWDFCFGGINNCNRLIFQYEQANNPVGNAFIAELKTLRAIFYLWLLDTYGNVPIVDRFDVPGDFAPANNTRQEVFDFIETEITGNRDNLSKDVSLATYGRVTYWTAQAALASLYLNAETWTGKDRYSDCVAACDEIIDSGNFDMEVDYFSNFATDNGASAEFIWSIPYDQVFAQGFNLPMMTLHYGSQATFNLTAQPWNGFCSLEEFYNSYEEDDVRRDGPEGRGYGNFITGPQTDVAGNPIEDSGASDPDGPVINFTPEINELRPGAYRQAGARVGKFEYAIGATEHLSNDFPIYRYTEVLLNKAEAMWRMNAGSADALELVNMVRERANATPFDALDADNLLAERGRELFAEVKRRTDLIRFGRYNDEWWGKTADGADADGEVGRFDPEVQLFPIPRGQIDANQNLVQNPGY
jgi:hypothetical protein